MPVWGQVILGTAAIVTALGVLWRMVLKPLLKFAKQADEMIPLLRELTKTFRNNPTAFAVLDEIVAQFRTDSGSSLRDVVDRLEDAAAAARATADRLEVNAAMTEKLAERDRQEVQNLILKIDRQSQAQEKIAENLVVAQRAVDAVASDLAEAHRRADDIPQSHAPGSAADAASKQSQTDLDVPDA